MAKHSSTACAQCGNNVQVKQGRGRAAKYCSEKCARKWRRLNSPLKPCTVEGCNNRHQARGLCAAHYKNWYAKTHPNFDPNPKHEMQCAACGKIIYKTKSGKRRPVCSYKCRSAITARKGTPRQLELPLHAVTDLRSSLRRAIEDGGNIIAAIEQRVTKTESGCWEWNGKIDKSGYAAFRYSKRGTMINVAVHRLALEAKHGQPLGTQAAHHICANAACVNPDHLQPVTHRENMAEMLARKYYIERIAELESELLRLDPTNDLLNVIGTKTIA